MCSLKYMYVKKYINKNYKTIYMYNTNHNKLTIII